MVKAYCSHCMNLHAARRRHNSIKSLWHKVLLVCVALDVLDGLFNGPLLPENIYSSQ